MIRQRKKVLGHAEDYSKVEWARHHSDRSDGGKKKPKQPTEEEQKSCVLKEMQSPVSFHTARADLADDQIIKQLFFFFFLFPPAVVRVVQVLTNHERTGVLFRCRRFYLWTNSSFFSLVGESQLLRNCPYCDVDAVELLSEQQAELGHSKALNWTMHW